MRSNQDLDGNIPRQSGGYIARITAKYAGSKSRMTLRVAFIFLLLPGVDLPNVLLASINLSARDEL